MQDERELFSVIQSVAKEYWDSYEKPLLLSGLPRLLSSQCGDFQSKLAGKRLKDYILDTSDVGGYKLVEHPLKEAKIGIIPADASYVFPDIETAQVKIKNNRAATLAFLSALDSLSLEDVDKVVIPTSILIKLLK